MHWVRFTLITTIAIGIRCPFSGNPNELTETEASLKAFISRLLKDKDNISKQFQRLTQTNIERSMSFWTKEDIKKPTTLITSTNFSKSRGKSKMRIELQEDILATIQKYFP